jgi:hypothetical protein
MSYGCFKTTSISVNLKCLVRILVTWVAHWNFLNSLSLLSDKDIFLFYFVNHPDAKLRDSC